MKMEKIGRNKIHALLHPGKFIRPFHAVFHIVAHDDEAVLPKRIGIIGVPARRFDNSDNFSVIFK